MEFWSLHEDRFDKDPEDKSFETLFGAKIFSFASQ